ncbi:hypothetical protein ACSBR1_003894 [Camellia fascicularis]
MVFQSACNMRLAGIEDTVELLEKQLASEMSKMTLEEALMLVRAFSLYLSLMGIAETHHRAIGMHFYVAFNPTYISIITCVKDNSVLPLSFNSSCVIIKYFKFNSPSSACTTGDWTAFLKSICSLLHVNKIFEVGISGSLQEQMKYLKLDIVQKAGSCISTDLAYVIGVIDVSRSKDKGSVTRLLMVKTFLNRLEGIYILILWIMTKFKVFVFRNKCLSTFSSLNEWIRNLFN